MNEKKLMAIWARKCALHILPIFEKTHTDSRPRNALDILQDWIDDKINCVPARKASVEVHACARECEKLSSEYLVARCCGQAIATAHAINHALIASYYAAKVIASVGGSIEEEIKWQKSILPKELWYRYDEEKVKHYAKIYKKK